MLPFQIGDSDMYWTVMIATSEAYIMKEINRITRFTIILTAIVIIVASVIVYSIFDFSTKPLEWVTWEIPGGMNEMANGTDQTSGKQCQ